jgi:hypothetical protein
LAEEISAIIAGRKKKSISFIAGVSGIGKTGVVLEVSREAGKTE